jgi:hypothetical protein
MVLLPSLTLTGTFHRKTLKMTVTFPGAGQLQFNSAAPHLRSVFNLLQDIQLKNKPTLSSFFSCYLFNHCFVLILTKNKQRPRTDFLLSVS